jgi:hypothetical protein
MAVNRDIKTGEIAQEAYLARVKKTMENLLSNYRRPVIEPKLQTDLENFLMTNGIDSKILNLLKKKVERSNL